MEKNISRIPSYIRSTFTKTRLIAMLMSLVTMMSVIQVPAYASSITPIQETSKLSLEMSSTGEYYLLNNSTGEKIIKAYTYNEDGELMEISLAEYARIINSTPVIPVTDNDSSKIGSESESARAITHTYIETSSYVGLGTPVKVSADVQGPGTVTSTFSTTISHSFGGSVSLSSTLKKVVQAGASFSWNVSASTQESTSYSFPIPAEKTGYIQFTPYLNVTIGDLYQGHSESALPDTFQGEVWGTSPKKLSSGFADGIFELVTK